MPHESLAHGACGGYHLLLDGPGCALGPAPGQLVRQSPEERDDGRHLRNGHDARVLVARVPEIVADATEQLVVIGRAAHPPLEAPEVLDEQVSRAVLADLEVLAARVDAAEDPREPRDQQVVLGDVAPGLA